MTEAPQFRVFLKQFEYNWQLKQLFNDGVPCESFYPLDDEKTIPEKFVFVVDHPLCSLEQYSQLDKFCEVDTEHTYLTEDDHPLLILVDNVHYVTSTDGKIKSLKTLKEDWIFNKNFSRFQEVSLTLSGEKFHHLIKVLQRSLRDKTSLVSEFKNVTFALAILFIEEVTQNDSELKELYLSYFPKVYRQAAQKKLFPE